MDAFDTLDFTSALASAQLEVHGISTLPNNLPTDFQEDPGPTGNPTLCIIA